MIGSAFFSALGLFLLSKASGGMIFAAATVFAVGVCFLWPTMLGYVSETFPKTGALGLAIMGGAGMLSVSFILPIIGIQYDSAIAGQLADGTTLDLLAEAEQLAIKAQAGLETLGQVAVIPAVLFAIFIVLAFTVKKQPTAAAQEELCQ